MKSGRQDMDMGEPERWTSRSLRLGMMVTAGAHGTSERRIMRQTCHRDRRFVHESLGQATAAEG